MADQELARFIDRHTIEYIRTFPHPIERVWKAITDPKELARWFIPTTKWDFEVGGAFRFHDDGYAGVVEAIEAPRYVRFSNPGGPGSYTEYTLNEIAGGTQMRFVAYAAPGPTYDALPEGRKDVPWGGGNLGGWHEYWDALGAHLDGVTTDSVLPPTPMSKLVALWVAEVELSHGMDPRLGARIRIGLRRKERWAELREIYEDYVVRSMPPLAKREGDRGG